MKTKDCKLLRDGTVDIADLREKQNLVVDMRGNAGENRPKKIVEFVDFKGVRNHFGTALEQWQNGLAEAVHEIGSHGDGGVWARGEILVQGSLRRKGWLQQRRGCGLATWQWRGYSSGVATDWLLLGSGVATAAASIRLGYLVAWIQK